MKPKQHITDVVFVLSLFCMFTVLSLFVVIQGADVYRGISGEMSDNFRARSSISYVTEKIRQNGNGGVEVREIDGCEALVLTQKVEGQSYETWIYAVDGSLKEMAISAGTRFAPKNGQEITELSSLSLSLENSGLLKITAVDPEGNAYHSFVALPGGDGEVRG